MTRGVPRSLPILTIPVIVETRSPTGTYGPFIVLEEQS